MKTRTAELCKLMCITDSSLGSLVTCAHTEVRDREGGKEKEREVERVTQRDVKMQSLAVSKSKCN